MTFIQEFYLGGVDNLIPNNTTYNNLYSIAIEFNSNGNQYNSFDVFWSNGEMHYIPGDSDNSIQINEYDLLGHHFISFSLSGFDSDNIFHQFKGTLCQSQYDHVEFHTLIDFYEI